MAATAEYIQALSTVVVEENTNEQACLPCNHVQDSFKSVQHRRTSKPRYVVAVSQNSLTMQKVTYSAQG